jgi:anti-anti-sigma factor
MAEALVVDLMHLDGSAVLMARGEVDMESAPVFGSAIEEALSLGVPVVVDCSGVTFMDSSGLNVLMLADRSADQHCSVQVQNPSPQVRRVLSLSGLGRMLVADATAIKEGRGSYRTRPPTDDSH